MTSESIKSYLGSKLGVNTAAVDDQTPLFSSGLLDSFSMLDLILFVESEAGIKMNPLDVNLDNLDSIERIKRYAQRAAL